ncbi:MAG: A/G-specific adenine glycosylase [Gemmatimonadetes bacterium]|nr:A/G-specific adenine glycosylase [Gemmatimonadota bacterium]
MRRSVGNGDGWRRYDAAMSTPSIPGFVESPEAVRSFRRRLLGFFDSEARDLPWRRTSDPYAIWVSEIMAQQTRVETAVPYYRRWLERYPDVHALAAAPIDAVLKSWEGLGYYSRARNLHRAARIVAETLGGRVPDTVDGLRALPGIGEYASGAIASIAFDRPAPAVDGNVRRVFARLHDDPSPTGSGVRDWAQRVVDPGRPGDFNQALMELGATVCTPRRPDCGSCPVADFCRARMAGTAEVRPAPKARTKVKSEVRLVAVFIDDSADERHLLMRRRPDEGLLAGMWEFPSRVAAARVGRRATMEALDALARAHGVPVGKALAERALPRPLEPVLHKFSHLHVEYRPWVVSTAGLDGSEPAQGPDLAAGSTRAERPTLVRWISATAVEELALPVAQQRIVTSALRPFTAGADPRAG